MKDKEFIFIEEIGKGLPSTHSCSTDCHPWGSLGKRSWLFNEVSLPIHYQPSALIFYMDQAPPVTHR